MYARDRLLRIARLAAVAIAFVGVAAMAHQGFMTVPVSVNGKRVAVRAGTTVAEVATASAGVHPGNILGALDQRVVATGAGGPMTVLVNGRAADRTERVRFGDTLQAFSGADIVEEVTVATRTVEAERRVIGSGPVERVITPGAAGVVRVTVGTVSGDVVATETVIAGQPAVVRRVPESGAAVVALTFDDGPWPRQTRAILDVLAEKDVPATFFMLGSRVKATPALARQVAQEGHAIGNHTYRHVRLDTATPEQVHSEIAVTNKAIAAATGVTPVWFRAPGGRLSPGVFAELKRVGMRSALWTVDPQDWRGGARADGIARAVIAGTRPGSVILLHDGGGDRSETIKALPMIIDGLRERGYQFVTLEEMEKVKASW